MHRITAGLLTLGLVALAAAPARAQSKVLLDTLTKSHPYAGKYCGDGASTSRRFEDHGTAIVAKMIQDVVVTRVTTDVQLLDGSGNNLVAGAARFVILDAAGQVVWASAATPLSAAKPSYASAAAAPATRLRKGDEYTIGLIWDGCGIFGMTDVLPDSAAFSVAGPATLDIASTAQIVRAYHVTGGGGVAVAAFSIEGLADGDADGDNVPDAVDDCPYAADPGSAQVDTDHDEVGDACDVLPGIADDDLDGDGIANEVDDCVLVADRDQLDHDEDGVGDACTPGATGGGGDGGTGPVVDGGAPAATDGGAGPARDAGTVVAPGSGSSATSLDSDGDLQPDSVDNCPNVANPDQRDSNHDGVGDACEVHPGGCAAGGAAGGGFAALALVLVLAFGRGATRRRGRGGDLGAGGGR